MKVKSCLSLPCGRHEASGVRGGGRRSSPAEDQEKVDRLREVSHELFGGEGYSDERIVHFLRSRRFNVREAAKVMRNHHAVCTGLEWNPARPIKIQTVKIMLMRQVFWTSNDCDVLGRRILYMRPAKFYPGTMVTSQLIEAMYYMLDVVHEDERTQQEGFTFVADMKNWDWNNFSIEYAQTFFAVLQFKYPCRVQRFVLVDAPSWFFRVWVLIRPGMTASFAAKWKMDVTRPTLSNYVPLNCIPDFFGGPVDASPEVFIRRRRAMETGRLSVEMSGSTHMYSDTASDMTQQLSEQRRSINARTNSVLQANAAGNDRTRITQFRTTTARAEIEPARG
eukprot:Plantae.Rhodophyta-Purpureofilum_apyrenoidigerum.ctg10102.p1 GENE.Plantae.Rhodophyta-Purpureofilum_apyrenoidigerum.ctg10102~~Plantae.Rhodophyta-Purpureofilum_apyrenoidigerum.ctg10102.p1  ORF type:complete len:355 (+),score=35.19 Plantae.Rhodophyta-Purpureofilum_apyrenoidigerum.ctg10102:58-1065(+)